MLSTAFRFLVLLLLCGAACGLSAQSLSNLRVKQIAVTDSVRIDSLSLVAGQTAIYAGVGGQQVLMDTADYTIYPLQSLLIWKRKPATDSITVRYRALPYALGSRYANKSYAAYQQSQMEFVMKPFEYRPVEAPQDFIDFGGLDYNGTFSRGLSFGNNQDVVLNSQFNLQLSGMVTKDIEVTAAITDNNIPFQPDGSTQKLQEFDKIFIQLKRLNQKVIVGDFDLYNPASAYFMRFSKKPQGGAYSGIFDLKKNGSLGTQVAGGVMRGKFARNILQVGEGNQGPYKLSGANGETFIVILANTEEVFINGVKMMRGADHDYVIDYNTAEIRFTPKRLITKDLRVVVEFEYSNQNYSRFIVYGNAEWNWKKGNIAFNAYHEQDSKSQTIQQTLDDNKRTFLSQIGDSVQNAFYPTIDSVGYDANRILYARRDTLGYDSVLVFSNNSTEAIYAASFLLVGAGQGDYIPIASTANGRVFAWIRPDTINGQVIHYGEYRPAQLLPAPQLVQMFSLAGNYKITENHVLGAEGALSNNDVNTLSQVDNKDNLGGAGKLTYKGIVVTKKEKDNGQSLTIDASYEFVQDRFKSIERFRAVEFNREWNTPAFTTPASEHLSVLNLNYAISKLGNITYRFRSYNQAGKYNGFENGVGATLQKNGFSINSFSTIVNARTETSTSLFIRPQVDVSYAIKKLRGWKIGAVANHEINSIKDISSDTLTSGSYLWQNYKVYFVSPDTARNKYGIEGIFRAEHQPGAEKFKAPHFIGQTINVFGNVTTIKNQSLQWNVTYRYADEKDSILRTSQLKNFYLGRVNYSFNVLKGFLRSSTLYEIGSGREQKIQITYQPSPTNTGDYVWKDSNEDGIKQLNEFVISPYREDSSYVKVFAVTADYVAVSSTQFSQTINLNPAVLLNGKTAKWAKIIGRISAFGSVELQRKLMAGKGLKPGNYFNPFPSKIEDSTLVSTSTTARTSVFYNRLDPKYGAQFDFSYLQNRVLLTSGFEERLSQSQGVTLRYNIIQALLLQATYTNGIRANRSDFYSAQRFRFHFNQAQAEIAYQYKTDFRIAANYLFARKVNPTDSVGKQTATVNQTSITARYNRNSKATFETKFTYSSIRYMDRDYANQQLEYAMLEGLSNGNNYVWNATIEYRLTTNVLLTFIYDGRKTGTAAVVHSGRAELRAIF